MKKIKPYTWCVTHSVRGQLYVMTKEKDKTIKLHRYLTKCPENKVIDHINHNPLDNRKDNLKICTITENAHNLKIRKNTCGYTYISFNKSNKNYRISINRNKVKFTKSFSTLNEAIKNRNKFLQDNFNKLDINKKALEEILKQ